jgi:nitrous oxide reductase accessory protein NosL
MKKMIFTCFAIALVTAACNSANESEKARQDSIEAAAMADSILNSALEADSLFNDTLVIDTGNTSEE